MKMANFLMPNGTTDSHVNNEADGDPDIASVGTVAVRRGPIGDIAASAVAVVVTNYGHDSVSFVDPDTLAIEGTIGVPGEPFAAVVSALAVDPTGERLYVATRDARGSQLVVVGAETARVDRKVWVGSPIRDLAFADGTAYVLTSDRMRGGAVSVIDMSTNRITDTIELGIGAPTQMTLSPDKTRAYVVDYDHVSVLCTLTHQVVAKVTVEARPSAVAVTPDGDRIVVADYAGDVGGFTVASTLPMFYSQL